MGFLGRLEREKEERFQRQREAEARRHREEQEQAASERTRENQRVAHLRENLAKSRSYFGQSSFPELLKSLARVASGDLAEIRENPDGTIGITLDLSTKSAQLDERHELVVTKYIEIESGPDGTIRVMGGLFGSSTLSLQDRQTHPDRQEDALEKAFNHPKFRSRKEWIHYMIDDAPGG